MQTTGSTENVFSIPTKLIHGVGTSVRVIPELENRNLQRILLVTDKGVRSAGVTKKLEALLTENNYYYSIYEDVEIDASVECVQRGAEIVKQENIDAVVVIGGGSPICAAKAIALLVTNGGMITDYEGISKAKAIPLPVIALPTTAGSGSEVSGAFLIKDYAADRKMSFRGFYHPIVAILDPVLLLSLPYWQAVCSSLDALSHSIDTLFSKQATSLTDGIALAAVKIMWKHLFPAASTDSLFSREQMLLASSMANIACGNAGLSLIHAATYGLHTLPHGYACGLMVPFAMEFNLLAATQKGNALARAMGIVGNFRTPSELAWEALAQVKLLYRELGFPNRLSEEEVPKTELSEMVRLTYNQRLLSLNIRRASEKDLTRIFESLYAGWEI
jgi:alcohol dehydrogenase class IV